MARMPDKKALLQLPLPKLPKHDDEDTCIVATIEDIQDKRVLNLYIRKPKFEVRIFFSEGSWINYIPSENKWSERTTEGNPNAWDFWIEPMYHRDYKTDKKSIDAMTAYFGIKDKSDLFSCLRTLEDYQSRKKYNNWRNKMRTEEKRQAAADRAVKEAKEKLVAEFEEDNKYILSQLDNERQKAATLQKQLALNDNKDTVKFSILFSSVQETLAELEALIETISEKDRETGAKYNNALQRLFKSKIESEE